MLFAASFEHNVVFTEIDLKMSRDCSQSVAKFPVMSDSSRSVFQRLYMLVDLYGLGVICIYLDGDTYGSTM